MASLLGGPSGVTWGGHLERTPRGVGYPGTTGDPGAANPPSQRGAEGQGGGGRAGAVAFHAVVPCAGGPGHWGRGAMPRWHTASLRSRP